MASPTPSGNSREKLNTKLPEFLRRTLKIRAAQLHMDLQDVVTEAVQGWRAHPTPLPQVDTSGAESFGTWLPEGLYDSFKEDCVQRGASYIQGLAQAVQLWLDGHPDTGTNTGIPRRFIVVNQKGGVGKTAIASGLAGAFAEEGEFKADVEILRYLKKHDKLRHSDEKTFTGPMQRTLVVDYDPQGHLSEQLGVPTFNYSEESLVTHMLTPSKATKPLEELLVQIPGERFGGRLYLLPSSLDAFLLDGGLSSFRGPRAAALENALKPIEHLFDVIIIDCPPSLGLAMDCGLYYARTRDEEHPRNSGVLIPVQAEDSSARAFGLLQQQIDALCADWGITLEQFGLIVNLFDSRKGYVTTSSLEKWMTMGTPPVLAVVRALKEVLEAVRVNRALLDYAPESEQAYCMREIVRKIA